MKLIHNKRWLRIGSMLLFGIGFYFLPAFAQAQCKAPGDPVTLTVTGNNTASGFDTRYAITNALGTIVQVSTSNVMSAPTDGGNYSAYAVNFTGSLTGLTVGSNINNLSGTCFAKSATPFAFCVTGPCKAPGETVNILNSGNNTGAGYTTQYALTDASGGILAVTSGSTFPAPSASGTYRIYAVNYTGTPTGLTPGGNIANVGSSTGCSATSATPYTFCVTAPCREGGSTFTFTNSGNNTGGTFTTQYLLTDAQGGILATSATPSFTLPTTGGNYGVSVLNYEGTVSGNTVGGNVKTITGTCFSRSATPVQVCVTNACRAPGSSLSFNAAGANASAGFQTAYVLVNDATGNIVSQVTSPMTVPNTRDVSYSLYTVNFQTSGTQPTLTAGTPFNAIGGSCVSVSSAPLRFSVCTTPLPVVLVDFTATKVGSKSQLSWKTSSEQNSSHFEVERSADGRTYASIGRVAAAGNSSTERTYSLPDALPLTGANYYRLKMVDIDGTVKYSAIRLLNFGGKAVIVMFPNPAQNSTTLTGTEAGMRVILTDAQGRRVREERISGATHSISVASLPSGLYQVQVVDGKGKAVWMQKLTKQ